MNRLESPEPDLQSDGGDFDAAIFELLENRRRKMQAGRRRGHRSRMRRENRLVTLAVGGFIARGKCREAAEYGRAARWPGSHRPLGRQANPAQAILPAANHFGGKLASSEFHALPHADLAARPNQGFPFLRRDRRVKKISISEDRNSRIVRRLWPGFSARTPRRRPNSRAGITRALFTTISSSPRRRSGKDRNSESSQAPCLAIQDQHAGGIPLVERALSDSLGGQFIVEIGKKHVGAA